MDMYKYKEQFLTSMHEITKYFYALEKLNWKGQNIQYRTKAAYEAEKQWIEAER
ncbi:MAG: hypothetical protein ACI4A5_02755 [Hominilimicola sp.]